jgi:ferredoxin
MGAFYGIIGKFSPTKIERNSNLCINCNLCSRSCPVNIDVAKADKVTSMECISCNKCVSACPKKGALQVKTAGKAISPLIMLAIIATLFFGTILVAQATGNFEVLPEALEQGETIPVSEVKGYFTIEETAKAIGIELEDTYKLLGIPENVPTTTKMKEISGIVPEYDFDAAKEKAEESVSVSEGIVSNEADKKTGLSELNGSTTIRQAAELLKMDLKDFYKLFKIPEDIPAQTMMKDIETLSPGYDFHKIKTELGE